MLQHPEHTKYDPKSKCVCPKCGHEAGPYIEYHRYERFSDCLRSIPGHNEHICVRCSFCGFARAYLTVDAT